MSYVRRYTDDNTDSLALVSISSGATFKNIPNGKYVDAVTGDVKYVTDGTLTVPELAKANAAQADLQVSTGRSAEILLTLNNAEYSTLNTILIL